MKIEPDSTDRRARSQDRGLPPGSTRVRITPRSAWISRADQPALVRIVRRVFFVAGVRSGDVRRGGEAAASADAGGRESSAAIRAFAAVATPAPLDLSGDPDVAHPLR